MTGIVILAYLVVSLAVAGWAWRASVAEDDLRVGWHRMFLAMRMAERHFWALAGSFRAVNRSLLESIERLKESAKTLDDPAES